VQQFLLYIHTLEYPLRVVSRPDRPSFKLPAVDTLKRYSKVLEYEYRVKTTALVSLKRYSILSPTLYLEWYCAYSILYSRGPH
jgi:hypothetical protein